MHEIPLAQGPLLALDDQERLARDDEERLGLVSQWYSEFGSPGSSTAS